MPPQTSSDRLHLFAVSFTPSAEQTNGPVLLVRRARFTTKWEDVDGIRAQVVEVTVANLAPATAFSSGSVTSPFEVYIVGSDTITVSPGYVNRLVASDQVRVDVLVYGTSSNSNVAVQINNSFGKIISVSDGWPVTPLRETWTPDTGVLSNHETPTWVRRDKLCIFHLFALIMQISGIKPNMVYCKLTIRVYFPIFTTPSTIAFIGDHTACPLGCVSLKLLIKRSF